MRFTLGCIHHFTQALATNPCSFIPVHSLVTNTLLVGAWGMQSNPHTEKRCTHKHNCNAFTLNLYCLLYKAPFQRLSDVKFFLQDLTDVGDERHNVVLMSPLFTDCFAAFVGGNTHTL